MPDWLTPELVWLSCGVALILLEFMVPGVILVFFGIGAVLTALLSWSDILNGVTSQLLFFCIVSPLLLFLLRRFFGRFFRGDSVEDGSFGDTAEYIGRMAKVTRGVGPDSPDGRVLFEGTEWKATSDLEILPGETVRIVGKTNITLKVAPVKVKGDS